MGEIQDALKEGLGKKLGGIAAFGMGALIIYAVIAVLFSFWPFSAVAGVVTRVTNPDAIIGNYEWFEDQYQGIKAYDQNLIAAKRIMGSASETTKDQRTTEYLGLLMVRNSQAAEYNARSRQITRALWKSGTLPYEIKEISE